MKPVPGRPIIGTTFPGIPLDSVRRWFQITRLFPGYRHHFSQGGMETVDSKAAPRSGRDFPRRIIHRVAQDNWVYLFTPPR